MHTGVFGFLYREPFLVINDAYFQSSAATQPNTIEIQMSLLPIESSSQRIVFNE